MSSNRLQKIESGAFEMIPQLVNLDLSNCELKRIAAKAFTQLTHLQKLDISGNELTEIRQKTVDTLKGEMSPIYCLARGTEALVM